MKYKGVIFDLDGTILNTIYDLGNSVNETLKKYGQPLHFFDKDKVGNKIVVRDAKEDQKIITLDGQDFCDKCGSIDIKRTSIDDWEELYEEKNSNKYLEE